MVISSIRPDIRLFSVSSIRPDTGIRQGKSGILPDTGNQKRPDYPARYPEHPNNSKYSNIQR
jgi:hypothetical protein